MIINILQKEGLTLINETFSQIRGLKLEKFEMRKRRGTLWRNYGDDDDGEDDRMRRRSFISKKRC